MPIGQPHNKDLASPICPNVSSIDKKLFYGKKKVLGVAFLGPVDFFFGELKSVLSRRCSWHKFRRCLLTVFPFLEWMCFYRFKDWLLGDLLAGISVGLVQIPQGKKDTRAFHTDNISLVQSKQVTCAR